MLACIRNTSALTQPELDAFTNFPYALSNACRPLFILVLKAGVNYSCPKSSPAESNIGPMAVGRRGGGGGKVAMGRVLNGAVVLSSPTAPAKAHPQKPFFSLFFLHKQR